MMDFLRPHPPTVQYVQLDIQFRTRLGSFVVVTVTRNGITYGKNTQALKTQLSGSFTIIVPLTKAPDASAKYTISVYTSKVRQGASEQTALASVTLSPVSIYEVSTTPTAATFSAGSICGEMVKKRKCPADSARIAMSVNPSAQNEYCEDFCESFAQTVCCEFDKATQYCFAYGTGTVDQVFALPWHNRGLSASRRVPF